MAKKQIAAGLNGLLNATPSNPHTQAPTAEAAEEHGRKTVLSFSVDETTAENIRYIAYYDRRKLSAVIAEALAQYIERWTPAPQEKPRKL